MRTMYDSTRATDIPTTAEMVAGYVSGPYQWSASDWARFPNATKVRIATQANVNDGHVLDCERFDATPQQCPQWVLMRRKAGVDPTIYCSESQWPDVVSAFNTANVPQPYYMIAHYDGIPTLPSIGSIHAIAKQYANSTMTLAHYDLSIVDNYWPGVDMAVELTDAALDAIAQRVWHFMNKTAGDKVDMHQYVKDAATRTITVTLTDQQLAMLAASIQFPTYKPVKG